MVGLFFLQGLTQVEEMLSAVLPIMSLYRLPHGQYGYSGHVINLPQDVASFANSLPRLPSELDVIIVRKEGASNTHRDFRVKRCKSKVTYINNTVVECNKCNLMMKVSKCDQSCTAKISVSGDEDRVLTLFSNMVSQIFNSR